MVKRRKSESRRAVPARHSILDDYVLFIVLIVGILLIVTCIAWVSVSPEAGGNLMSKLMVYFWSSLGGGAMLTALVLLAAELIGSYFDSEADLETGEDTW